jgi:hypothetical protein
VASSCYDSVVQQNEPGGGPYLTGVFFCERVLREADGVMSFIRVIEKWTVQGPAESIPPTVIPLTLVVMGKSGMYRGSGQITLTPTTPSGERMPPIPMAVVFEGDNDRGFAASGTIGFPIKEAGAYWFELALDGAPLTYTAIRIVYMRTSLGPVPPQSQ